jgi:hypothetical protein
MINATFSNGLTDTYKGSREVKAAWMVILPSGKTISGHSLDFQKAEKTAKNNASDRAGTLPMLKAGAVSPAYMVHRERELKEEGFKTLRQYNNDIKAKRAAFVKACKIEVINL